MPVWVPVILPVFAAAVGYYLPRRAYRLWLSATQIAEVVIVTLLFLEVRADGPVRTVVAGWPDGAGIALSADLFSSLLVALAGWFFLFMLAFAARKHYTNRLFMFLFVTLEGLLIGTFLSGDLFNVYVLLELSTLVVSILIMYKRDKQTLYDGMFYLMMNLASMSFMLLGIGFVYRALGSLDFSQIAVRAAAVSNPRSLIVPFALVFTGVGLKSAFFLLNAWLPKAHGAPSAPSIVSAILSGIQVKAGVYLVVRMLELFGAALPLQPLLLALGFAGAVSGFVLAMAQEQIKLVLAYSTISQIGLIVVGLAAGTQAQFYGALLHVVNHAFAKALLFLCAGIMIHRYGTKKLAQIRGVFRTMPLIGVAAAAGILAIVGTPLFNGSISKYLIQGTLVWEPVQLGILLVNLGTATTFAKFATVLFGAPSTQAASGELSRQPDPWTTGVVLVLGLSCLAAGIFAAPIIRTLFQTDLSISGALATQKLVIYAVTVGLALLIYRFVVRGSRVLAWIGGRTFYFNDVMAGVVLLFATTVAYLALSV